LMVAGAGQRLLLFRQNGVINIHQEYTLSKLLGCLSVIASPTVLKRAKGLARSVLPRAGIVQFGLQFDLQFVRLFVFRLASVVVQGPEHLTCISGIGPKGLRSRVEVKLVLLRFPPLIPRMGE
jgi:hypothetical protein